MSVAPSLWYTGYIPTAADFQDAFASKAPVSTAADAKAYTDAQIAQSKNIAVAAAYAFDVLQVPLTGGPIAFTRPDVTKISTVSADVNGNLIVTGAALCNGPLSVGGDLSVAGTFTASGAANVGGDLHVTGNGLFGQAVAVNGSLAVAQAAQVTGTLKVKGRCNLTGLSPFPDQFSAVAGGLLFGDVYYNTTSGALSVVVVGGP